ncbi:hypothetical protein ACH4KT_04060 [Streptomyces anulatus]
MGCDEVLALLREQGGDLPSEGRTVAEGKRELLGERLAEIRRVRGLT